MLNIVTLYTMDNYKKQRNEESSPRAENFGAFHLSKAPFFTSGYAIYLLQVIMALLFLQRLVGFTQYS
ncbi:hypothetical protein pdam_00005417 [Pocillopora damicornis]|uniref:Uncharacterized protein n=1 Tax=Pocillopora damicornis TaxID=46731 RepID=A0A3M6U3Z5_POCDA|nr:hypothetical protein pdam_00005417 [Pocillopora damicornis]